MPKDKPLSGKKVAVLVETEYIYDEIQYYREHILALGGEVFFLAYLWGKPSIDLVNDVDTPDRPVTDMHRLTVNMCVTQHDPSEFDIVICAANYVAVRLREVPPMGSLATPDLVSTAPAVRFYAKAMENKNILKAAMCHALWILTPRPDLLKGRRIICHTVVLADIHNAGATYIADPSHVVVDDDLVTGRSFADIEPYFNAIVQTSTQRPTLPPPSSNVSTILSNTVTSLINTLTARYEEAATNFKPNYRPVSRAAKALLDGSLDVVSEVKRMTGVDFAPLNVKRRKPVLLAASKFGTWASEVTLVAGLLLKAGYKVKIATEDGTPPHFLGPSLDPDFRDGAWRSSVVSPEERDLAIRFLNPKSPENYLFNPKSIFNLGDLPKPPQVGDYIKNPKLLAAYQAALSSAVALAVDYEAIVIAGGSGAVPGFMDDRGLQALILAFYKLEKPVMAECNGGLVVAQTIDPDTGSSILCGRAVTTHSWLDEYQSGWGWTAPYTLPPNQYWPQGKFSLPKYEKDETWITPGVGGNPLIDSSALFKNAAGPGGLFFSPPGSTYAVVVDANLITCRTTPDGYPGTLALLATLDGRPPLEGPFFIDSDSQGRPQP